MIKNINIMITVIYNQLKKEKNKTNIQQIKLMLMILHLGLFN